MGVFSKGKKNVFSDTEIAWGKNYLKINGAFLETGEFIGQFRVPLNAIETVVIKILEPVESLNPVKIAKDPITPKVVLIGKGTKLAYLKAVKEFNKVLKEEIIGNNLPKYIHCLFII